MILKRIMNLWRLSDFEPRTLGSEPAPEGTKIATLVQKPQKASFIPRIKISPVEKITKE